METHGVYKLHKNEERVHIKQLQQQKKETENQPYRNKFCKLKERFQWNESFRCVSSLSPRGASHQTRQAKCTGAKVMKRECAGGSLSLSWSFHFTFETSMQKQWQRLRSKHARSFLRRCKVCGHWFLAQKDTASRCHLKLTEKRASYWQSGHMIAVFFRHPFFRHVAVQVCICSHWAFEISGLHFP